MTTAALNRNTVRGGLLILFVVVIVYSSSIAGGFLWDDNDHVSEVMPLRSLQGLRDIWLTPGTTCQYYPLTFTSFWAQYQCWQLNVAGYHAVNVLLHTANTWLLLLLLMRLRLRGAWAGALLFAVHPVNVMSVAWITELKNVQSGFFLLLAAHAFLGFAEEDRGSGRVLIRGAATVLLFLLALLTKTAAVILPPGLLLLIWWKNGRVRMREGVLLGLLFAGGVFAGFGTLWLERTFVGASGTEFDLTLLERVLVSGRVFWFYLGKILWPVGLSFIYPRWETGAGSFADYLPLVALAVLLAWLIAQRKKLGRGPLTLTVYFFFASSVLVVFQAIYMTRYTFVSDHWLYYATMGVLPFAGSYVFRRGQDSLGDGRVTIVSCAVLILLGTMSWQRGRVYRNAETLWRDTLEKNPASWMAQSNYGLVLAQRGDYQGALDRYREAVRLKPDLANAYNNMGLSFRAMKRNEDAVASYEKALSIEPGHVESMNNMALVLASEGKTEQARRILEKAIATRKDYAEPYNTLGMLLHSEGDVEGAVDSFSEAVGLDPYHINAMNNLAASQLSLGHVKESIQTYGEALKLDQRNPAVHYNMALAQGRNGDAAEAERHFRAAIRANPAFDAAYADLGAQLFSTGRYGEAFEVLTKGAEVAPGNSAIQGNLGAVLLAMGDIEGAKHHLSEALRLNPGNASAKKNLQIAVEQQRHR